MKESRANPSGPPLAAVGLLALGLLIAVIGALLLFSRSSPEVFPFNDRPSESSINPDPESALALARGYVASPSRIESRVKPGDRIDLIDVANGSSEEVRVTVSFYPGSRQALDGSVIAFESPEGQRIGQRYLQLSRRDLRLAPGERASINALITKAIPKNRALFGMVYASFLPAINNSDELETEIRLGSFLGLRYPGYRPGRARLEAINVNPGPSGGISISLLAGNRTRGLARPDGQATIYDQSGGLVWSEGLLFGQGVLPGQQRELRLESERIALAPGRYRVEGQLQGRGRGQAEKSFVVSSSGSLAAPALEMQAALSETEVALGEEFSVGFQIESDSEIAFRPEVRARIYSLSSEQLVAELRGVGGQLLPGETTEESLVFDGLYDRGDYAVSAEALSPDGRVLEQQQLLMKAGENTGEESGGGVLEWLGQHPGITLLIGMLLAGVGILLALAVVSLIRSRSQEGKTASND